MDTTKINLNSNTHGTTSNPTTTTYTVTVQSVSGQNKYFIDGVQTPNLTLIGGNTYIFDWSSATGHPFKFSTTADGTHGSGSEYTTGVTVDSSNYKTTIVVSNSAPSTLYYYCSNHSGMGGSFTTVSGGTSLDSSGNGTLTSTTNPSINNLNGGDYTFLASGTFATGRTLTLQHKVGEEFIDIGTDAVLTAPGGCVFTTSASEIRLVVSGSNESSTSTEDLYVEISPL